MKRTAILMWLLVAPLALLAQVRGDQVTVNDYEEIYSTYTLTSADKSEIRSAVGQSTLDDIITYAHEDNWPSGMKTLDGRNENRSKMYNYYSEYVCSFGDKIVLLIPKSKNTHMPYAMRPVSHDIYFYITATAVNRGGSSSRGSSGGSITVTDYEEMYSTYTLDSDDKAEIRDQVGQSVLDDIITWSHEDNWPSGMKTLEGRNENRSKMYNWNVEFVCTFGDKTVIKVPKASNTSAPYSIRPVSHDIYIIISSSAVKRGGGSSGNSGGAITVTDYEEMYSTYTLDSDDKAEIRDQVGQSVLDDIITWSHEDNWPSGMKTLEGRNENRSKMYNWNVEFVCTFGDKTVIRVPKASNTSAPYSIRPIAHDIYIIISSSAVRR